MKKNSAVLIIIILVVIVIIVLLIVGSNKQNNLGSNYVAPTDTSVTPTTTPTTTTPTPVLFSSSPLSQNAFLISTATYDAKTKAALSGFTVTKKTLADGSLQYTLNSTNADYQTQTYTVKTGEKLYFIEALPSDDNGTGDRTIADDSAVVVDANGYIVSQ